MLGGGIEVGVAKHILTLSLGYSRVAIEYELYCNVKDIDKCVEFEMPEVKVPNIFFGTVGFSTLRDGRLS